MYLLLSLASVCFAYELHAGSYPVYFWTPANATATTGRLFHGTWVSPDGHGGRIYLSGEKHPEYVFVQLAFFEEFWEDSASHLWVFQTKTFGSIHATQVDLLVDQTSACKADVDLEVSSVGTSFTIEGIVSGCGRELHLQGSELTAEELISNARTYCLLTTCLLFGVLYAYHEHHAQCQADSSVTERTSLGLLICNLAFDALLLAWNAWMAFTAQLTGGWHCFLAFWTIVSLIVLCSGLIMPVWQAHHPRLPETSAHTYRIERLEFKIKVILLLFGLLLAVFKLQKLAIYFVASFSSFFFFQILKNVREQSLNPLKSTGVLTLAFGRAAMIIYHFGLPAATLKWRPSFWTAVLIASCIVAQALFLLLHEQYLVFMKKKTKCKYLVVEECTEEDDCVICMNELRSKNSRIMVTPCAHFYHVDCLEDWLTVKLACPTCRTNLPPLETS